jgi:DnaK suppressor protein
MTRKQVILRMRQVLLRRRAALLRSLRGELGRFSTSDERHVGDAVDEALDTDYGMINARLAETESRELKAIENALRLMRRGAYGICENCGEKIPVVRLQALPYATSCIACQRHSERGRIAEAAAGDWSRVRDPSDTSDELTFDEIEFIS